MTSENLVNRAGKSLGSAAEFYNQLAAVRSFREQGLLPSDTAVEEMQRLAFEMKKEAQNVCTLLDHFLKAGLKA